ncbi:MAG: hypothetical protein VYB54_12545 [Pseudomonadota bacterium]|nr:hypothetical protein [Pseudomonadota bacterium]
MRGLFLTLGTLGAMLTAPASAFEHLLYEAAADAVTKHMLSLDVFDGARVSEAHVPWDARTMRVTFGTENSDTVSAVLFARDDALEGLRIEVPLLPSADPGLYAVAEMAIALEPAMKTLDHAKDVDLREAVKRWAADLGIESWMRPRYGAYRIERRVGRTLFVFEGVPLERIWVTLTPVGSAHPVLDDLMPQVPPADRAKAEPVFIAIERGEYKLADRLATPHAEQGDAWALLVKADYGIPAGKGRDVSLRINAMLEQAADGGFAPAQFVLGTPESPSAERWLKKAALSGYGPAIALKASRLYQTGAFDDPGARCDELAAAQGNAMAQLRTVYRYAEGGGAPDTAYFWGRIALETFGETASFTAERYILNTLGVLSRMIEPDRRAELDASAAAWTSTGFKDLKPKYDALGCLE